MTRKVKLPTSIIRVVIDSRDARQDRWMTRENAERLLAEDKLVSAVIYASERCYMPRRAHAAEVARYFLPRNAKAVLGHVAFYQMPTNDTR